MAGDSRSLGKATRPSTGPVETQLSYALQTNDRLRVPRRWAQPRHVTDFFKQKKRSASRSHRHAGVLARGGLFFGAERHSPSRILYLERSELRRTLASAHRNGSDGPAAARRVSGGKNSRHPAAVYVAARRYLRSSRSAR